MVMEFNLPPNYSEIDKVVVLGMGGSAIGGDLASSLAALEAKLPVLVHRDYHLPAFVDSRTLVGGRSAGGKGSGTFSVEWLAGSFVARTIAGCKSCRASGPTRATSTLATAAPDRYSRRHEQGTRTSDPAPPDSSDSCGCAPHRKGC